MSGDHAGSVSLPGEPQGHKDHSPEPRARIGGGDLRALLKRETAAAHERLDAGFETLDLRDAEGYARFLQAHAVGLAGAFPAVKRFAREALGQSLPDLPGMIARDLATTRWPQPLSLPARAAPPSRNAALAGAGATYVVLGSRLGMAVLRKRGYWRGGPQGTGHSRYMEDNGSLAPWRALLDWMSRQPEDPRKAEAMLREALCTFALFEEGLALAAQMPAGGAAPHAPLA